MSNFDFSRWFPKGSRFLGACVANVAAQISGGTLSPYVVGARLTRIIENNRLPPHVRNFARDVLLALGQGT